MSTRVGYTILKMLKSEGNGVHTSTSVLVPLGISIGSHYEEDGIV